MPRAQGAGHRLRILFARFIRKIFRASRGAHPSEMAASVHGYWRAPAEDQLNTPVPILNFLVSAPMANSSGDGNYGEC